MPPKERYTREVILEAAFALVRERGAEALNARAIAARLGCSTQPLFRQFSSMEDIRMAVLRKAADSYNMAITASADLAPTPYKGTGLAYIKFAHEEPQLFKLLFMRDRIHGGDSRKNDDENIDYIISTIQRGTGFSREDALLFHQHLWVFSHGLAVMIATNYIDYCPEEISRLLSEEYFAIRRSFEAKQLG